MSSKRNKTHFSVVVYVSASSSILVCNYDSSAENRAADGQFTISNIDPNLCTHLIYASSDINVANELVPTKPTDLQDYSAFNALKSRSDL